MSTVPSVLYESTTKISLAQPLTEPRARGKFFSSLNVRRTTAMDASGMGGSRLPCFPGQGKPRSVHLPKPADAFKEQGHETRAPEAALQTLAVEEADVTPLGVEVFVEFQEHDQ